MVGNYLKLAVRNLSKRRGYAILNIAGLTIGMTCCLLIFHYVSFERSYDDFHPAANDIVRLRLDSYQGKLAWKSATIYPAIPPTMKKDFPEVVDFCRLIDAEVMLTNDATNTKFNEIKGYFADPSVLKMFGIKLLKGNPATALDAPDKLLVSETMAKKYFGNDEPMGKKLTVRDPRLTQTYQVTGVFKDYPANSHLDIKYLVSYSTLGRNLRQFGDSSDATNTNWGWYDFYGYLQLRPGTDLKKFEAKFPGFVKRNLDTMSFYKTNGYKHELSIMPVTAIHLESNYNQEAEVNGSGQAVGFLFLVAIFIIGIAWINYINLATARSVERAREVGVRKVMGAMKADLIRQFLIESFVLNLVSLLISVAVFFALINLFDVFVGRDHATGISLTPSYWRIFIGLFLLGTVLSGIYPAFVLSGFQPVKVLKGVFKNTTSGLLLRKGLIITQFVTSVVLIAGTIIVYQQLKYMRDQKLGLNINQTLVLEGAGTVVDSVYQNVYQPFKGELLQQPGIKTVTSSSNVAGKEIYWTNSLRRIGAQNEVPVTLYHLGVDYDYIPSYEVQLLAGRNFSKEFKTDEKAVLLNETAAQLLGFKTPQEAINGRLRRNRDTLTIIGITANFHHEGLQKAIQPQILMLTPNIRSYYSLKVETSDVQKTVASVEKVWNKHFPADPLNYFFLDDLFNSQYKSEMLFGKVFGIFSFLAILIACFGLLGLSAYNVLQRTKEIGIRKVMGASVNSILVLLSKDFMKLVLIALVLAIPVGWYIMNNWLQDFAYRINVSWWVFALAGALALLIALVTIGLQVLKAAVDNPVKSLRSE